MRFTRTLAAGSLVLLAVACGRGSDDSVAAASDLASGNATLAPAVNVAAAKSGPAYSEQSNPAIIAGAGHYLAAWTEVHLATKRSTVVAARIGADGKLLDTQSIALGAGDDSDVSIAFDGTSYLAVWAHKNGAGSIISGQRIGADGKVLDAPIKLGRANGNATRPAVAYTTGGYLVAWSDDRDSGASADSYVNEVYGARISTAGAIVGSAEGFRITDAAGTLDGHLEIAAAGATFLVGYAKKTASGTSANAVRVSDAGAVEGTLALGAGTSPAISADGSQFFVAWNDGQHVTGARVSKDGVKQGDSIQVVATPGTPSVAWDGEAFTVASTAGTQRVGANGALMGGPLGAGSAVASLDASLLVIRSVAADVLPARVSGTLLPKAGGAATKADIMLARGPAALQKNVATAAHGSSSLSVWLEYEDAAHPKLAGAIFANGAATPVVIDPGTTTTNGAPTVAFDGSSYIVAWETTEGTTAVHVGDSGMVLDTPRTYLGAHPQLTAGAAGKVLLTTRKAEKNSAVLIGSTSDTVLDIKAEPTGWLTSPLGQSAWDGSRYVLAWSTTKNDGNAEIHAQRFDKNGAPMDAPAVKIATLPLPTGTALPTVAVATSGLDTLLAFASPTTRQILGARLSASGLADTTPVRLDVGTSGFAFEPRLAFDGTQWTLAYERRSDAFVADPAGYALELTRIRGGASLDVNPKVQAIASHGLLPSLAAGVNGTTFIGYESIGTEDLAGPRIALSTFADTGSANPGTSSGGSTTGDDDDGEVTAPGDDDDGTTKKPSKAPSAGTKGATIKPVGGGSSGGANGSGGDSGGCSTSGSSGSTRGSSSTFVLVALSALLMRRRFARRLRVPHARR